MLDNIMDFLFKLMMILAFVFMDICLVILVIMSIVWIMHLCFVV